MRERVARRYNFSEKGREALRRARADARPIDEACVARFVDDRPKTAPAVRVRHAKFGEGTIVRVVEVEKVEIAFDSAGTKILLRKFVQDIS